VPGWRQTVWIRLQRVLSGRLVGLHLVVLEPDVESLREPQRPSRGHALEITLTDVDMAGEFETWRGPQACSVRVMLDIYAPRIRLDFHLTDRDGKVVSSGSRDLRDPLYLTRAVFLAADALRYEKNLLLEWLQREFGGVTK
jgi:hypothetical protein